MILRVAAFTDAGLALAQKIGPADRPESVMAWARAWFSVAQALVFVGASGIAVRAIAPLVASKLTDPAVLVVDEAGRFVIPILSGHVGGANQLARALAEKLHATAVITTATDVNQLPAIDEWAARSDMAIEPSQGIKAFSGALLSGERVGVAITEREIAPPFPVTLWLRPRTLVLGIGTKRGVESAHLQDCVARFLKDAGVSMLSVRAFATIDLKKEEPAILALSERWHLPLKTYAARELEQVPGRFLGSEWVLRSVGVDNVCERAAVKESGGALLVGKTRFEGITLALAGKEDI
ncbi:MAG: cobalt-precorrin 5A hydrolase [Clostridia bacterium]